MTGSGDRVEEEEAEEKKDNEGGRAGIRIPGARATMSVWKANDT